MTYRDAWAALAVIAVLTAGCGGEGDGGPGLPLGAECTAPSDCANQCLPQFTGGYCGLVGCRSDADCPTASACILHTDAVPYCFRECASSLDCNDERSADHEAFCTDNIVFVDDPGGRRACVPPG